MGQFEDYLQKKRQTELGKEVQQNEQQLTVNLNKQEVYSAEDEIEQQYNRIAESTFAERNQYYFADQNMLKSKEQKYTNLAGAGYGNLKTFAQQHTNRSAYKRKKASKNAAKKFRELEKKQQVYQKRVSDLKGENNMGYQEYYRNVSEMAELRLAAMREVAKVKATDENDEKYRIAKSQFRIYTMLYEQSKTKSELGTDKELMGDLQQKIETAMNDMKTYGTDRQATKKLEKHIEWRKTDIPGKMVEAKSKGEESQFWHRKEVERKQGHDAGNPEGANAMSLEKLRTSFEEDRDQNTAERFTPENYELYKKYRETNAQMRHPDLKFYFDAKVTYRYIQEISRMGGTALRVCHYDKNWQPISEQDKENHAYNLKVGELIVKTRSGDADSEAELTEMMKKRVDDIVDNAPEFPSPEVIEAQLLKPLQEGKSLADTGCPFAENAIKDREKFSEIAAHGLTSESLPKFLPGVKEHIKEHPKVEAYFDMISWYSQMVNAYSMDVYSINLELGTNAKPKYAKANKDMVQLNLTMYKAAYEKFQAADK